MQIFVEISVDAGSDRLDPIRSSVDAGSDRIGTSRMSISKASVKSICASIKAAARAELCLRPLTGVSVCMGKLLKAFSAVSTPIGERHSKKNQYFWRSTRFACPSIDRLEQCREVRGEGVLVHGQNPGAFSRPRLRRAADGSAWA